MYWRLRNRGLEEATRGFFEGVGMVGVERVVSVGERMDLREALEREVQEAERLGEGVAVVVSGPAGMADEVRRTVVRLVREGKGVEVGFVEECYSW